MSFVRLQHHKVQLGKKKAKISPLTRKTCDGHLEAPNFDYLANQIQYVVKPTTQEEN